MTNFMKSKIQKLKQDALKEIKSSETFDFLKNIEKKYLGRKGELTNIFHEIKNVSKEVRKDIGKFANQSKKELEIALKEAGENFKEATASKILGNDWLDITLPTEKKLGHLHPLSQIQYDIEDIFSSMGFMILDGPELESEFYNFEALNIPKDHPARDMQDTFYIKSKHQTPNAKEKSITNNQISNSQLVLRTHTSNLQVRAMQKYGAPLRAIFPGRVFRSEATDAGHDTTFDQVEGLMIDKNISIANLISTMKALLSGIFKRDVVVRLRPGYFPFVEPGFELDIECLICGGSGCSVCKGNGWLELLPCGMVHPNVLKYGGINSKKYSGFAFGLGFTRLVMMKYKISDIRLMLGGDLRFLNQF